MIKNNTKARRAAAILSSDTLRAATGGYVLNQNILRGCAQCSQVLSFDLADIRVQY
jgi:hypothetical protein